MPVTIGNRTLGVAENGIFSDINTDPIPGGRLWNGSGSYAPRGDLGAAQSWNDMRAFIGAKHGVWIMPNGPASSARNRAQQDYFWTHQPPPAAPPYTSNHGWGLAVDVATRTMAFYILRYGPMFGWSHDEGARVGEWWHMRYVGGYTRRILLDPQNVLTPQEKWWVRQYDDASAARKARILNAVHGDIVDIQKRARSERGGWSKHQRGARYQYLSAWYAHRRAAPRAAAAAAPERVSAVLPSTQPRSTNPMDWSKFPINRIVALAAGPISTLAGLIAGFLATHDLGLHFGRDSLAKAITFIVTAAITTGVHYAAAHKWLSGWQAWETRLFDIFGAGGEPTAGVPLDVAPETAVTPDRPDAA